MAPWLTSALKIGELLLSLVWRRAQKKDDPNEQKKQRDKEADAAVVSGDAVEVNRLLDDAEQRRLLNQTGRPPGG
jgi:hypothetical protein